MFTQKIIALSMVLALGLLYQQVMAKPTGEEADYNTPNPTGSTEINEGAAQQRKEYLERQEEKDRAQNNELPKPYQVDKSGDTTEHHKR